jgi:hypothetical protein
VAAGTAWTARPLLLAIVNVGGLAHARVLRSMELMAKHVLGALG